MTRMAFFTRKRICVLVRSEMALMMPLHMKTIADITMYPRQMVARSGSRSVFSCSSEEVARTYHRCVYFFLLRRVVRMPRGDRFD